MNFNDPDILALAGNVANSIQVIFDTNSSSEQRHNATVFCEDFRTRATSLELCTVGFVFVSRFQAAQAGLDDNYKVTSLEPHLALVGMQFVEDVVKFRWAQFEERALVKGYIIQMMQNGLSQNPSQINEIPHYLHEMIARIIVEIAKREWPQFWPDLFPTLLNLLPTSDLPLLILRRLAEDVFILQRVDSVNRRKDLSQCLHVVCGDVLTRLFSTLQESLTQFQSTNSEALKRRIKLILQTIQPFVEWSKISCFTCEDRMQSLFSLLLNQDFRLEAADCIIELAERKTFRKEERYDIPNACLNSTTFSSFTNAIINCDQQDEEFLKKLGNILTVLCMSSLGVEEIAASNLMKGLVTMASRSDAISTVSAIVGANSFMKMVTKELVGTKNWLESGLVNLIELIVKKCTSPPKNSERREIVRMRQEFPMLLRKVGKALPDLYFFISSWLHNYLSDPSKVEAFQWDALIMVMGAIQSFVQTEYSAIVDLGLQDLETCFMKFSSETDLKTKSFILSGVSALFVFLFLSGERNENNEKHSTLLHSILEGIFNCFPHEHVSQHAASLMVKLSADFPELLLPCFDIICASTIKLMPSIKSSEYQRLVEALILLSNRWNDPVKQAAFMGQLINPLVYQHISTISSTPQHFAQMFQDESRFAQERFVIHNLSICNGILRRAKLTPENTETSNQPLQQPHPAMTHFMPVISASLAYIKAIHSLLQIPELKFIMAIDNSEMCLLMGITHWSTDAEWKLVNAHLEPLSYQKQQSSKTDSLTVKFHETIKKFVRNSLESAYGILGHSFSAFSPDIYTVPEIGATVLECVAGHYQLLDDYRMYIIMRNVLKPFLLSCPLASIDAVVKPVLQNLLPVMLTRLQTRWSEVNDNEGSEGDVKEILESCALRLFTKEFLDIMQLLLGYSKSHKATGGTDASDGKAADNDDSGAEMELDTEANGSSQEKHNHSFSYVETGAMNVLLEDQTCSRVILHLCLKALTWSDKLVNLRASNCLVQCWSVISQDVQILHAVFVECLRGILVIDDPETRDILQKLILLVCSTSLEKDPAIAQILLEWGARESDVRKLISTCQSGTNDIGRTKKDCLRKMIRNNPNMQTTKGAREKWLNNLPKVNIYKLADRIEQSVSLADYSSDIHQG